MAAKTSRSVLEHIAEADGSDAPAGMAERQKPLELACSDESNLGLDDLPVASGGLGTGTGSLVLDPNLALANMMQMMLQQQAQQTMINQSLMEQMRSTTELMTAMQRAHGQDSISLTAAVGTSQPRTAGGSMAALPSTPKVPIPEFIAEIIDRDASKFGNKYGSA